MEQHGKNLAASHKLKEGFGPDILLARLKSNEEVLNNVYALLKGMAGENLRITPAGEWLLDNFYLIEDQINTAKRHLPKGYSRELPCLQNGGSKFGLPRAYSIALEIISHGDGRVDYENLSRFITAYQTVANLKLGELWAIPIMLRLALIENLYRVANIIASSCADRDLANKWADRISDTSEKDPINLISVVADMANSKPLLTSTFVAELARRMHAQKSVFILPMSWVEQQLAEKGLSIDHMVHTVNQQLAADQVSVSNSITSLRSLGSTDWREFVEKMSTVENTLRNDPFGVYGRMSFSTRDRYRHVVERIAKNSRFSEVEVAQRALNMTKSNAGQTDRDDKRSHIGYYLIDEGLKILENEAHTHVSLMQSLQRRGLQFPLFLYLGSVAFLASFFALILLTGVQAVSLPYLLSIILIVLALLSTSHLAIALVNWLATVLAVPYPLPCMDYSEGVPEKAVTLVVTPTMLSSIRNIDDLTEALEVRFLANQDGNLYFGLLTDFHDAENETMPSDDELVNYASEQITKLNNKYRREGNDPFFLFHRPRVWNIREMKWMGYERKRGKLAALNGFLRGNSEEKFSCITGETAILLKVKYVITLDTDTQMPRDAAREMVGAMMHPLNRAIYDGSKQRVIEGYGILQPRVSVSLPGATRSRYAKMFGRNAGVDPYTNAVSDVYQDWFQEGSFIGKGIYDVDAFQLALNGRFPENKILSHDLLEGCYARSGLLSNVQLYEEYPSSYVSDVSRRYRWIRGDWQIGRWLLPLVPGLDGKHQKNPLSALSTWKLFDNLRRSLAPAALISLFILGWTVLKSPLFSTVSLISILLIPSLVTSFMYLLRKSEDVQWRRHLSESASIIGQNLLQEGFTLTCLPYEAYYSLEAMLRTVWRLQISKRRLLEWTSSGDIRYSRVPHLPAFYRMMITAPVLSAVTIIYLAVFNTEVLIIAVPLLLLWLFSPVIAWWMSKPLFRAVPVLTTDQTSYLHRISRKTWLFFETFVGPEDNWLPPDNIQEHPSRTIAHRTSPTNIGLSLLANLAAYDFGYIQSGKLIERTENTFRTMEIMERYHGHFYNWYDTQSLKILQPPYISTVDSGNFAGHLLTLQAGLLSLADEPILSKRWLEGITDTFNTLIDDDKTALSGSHSSFKDLLNSIVISNHYIMSDVLSCINRLISALEDNATNTHNNPVNDPAEWTKILTRQCIDSRDELILMAPWLDFHVENKDIRKILYDIEIPTLREISMLEFNSLPVIDDKLSRLIKQARFKACERIKSFETAALKCGEFAKIEYDFLYNKTSRLLTIGYNVSEKRQDASYYDLLASEARLCCFTGIAQGQLPQESWFALGRLLTVAAGDPILISWSGSMFEYLMPLIVMPTYESTLLDQTYKAAVARQIEYSKICGVPWGMSESGYNSVDINMNYQYRAFGVPGLGLKRGLGSEIVVAPYASMLALMVDAEAACINLQKLDSIGLMGKFGFYEAIDYTPSRIPHKKESVIIQSFMAHHQGMGFLSLAYLLLNRPMQKRFESAPMFQAANLLLQERIPRNSALYSHKIGETTELYSDTDNQISSVRMFDNPDTPFPEVQLLSNGRYHLMVTNAGGGYSRWKDIAVTRWREDATSDSWGCFCYIRDADSGELWSTAYQPTLKKPDFYEVIFSESRAEFRRKNFGIETNYEIVVSPEDDIELRRVKITNRSKTRRTIQVVSYAEVVLASSESDALHPVFSNMFVQTEILGQQSAILCTRRPRSNDDVSPWMFNLMVVRGAERGVVSFETDRMQFIGRGNTAADPLALRKNDMLSNSSGSVLDPVTAIRYQITIEPQESAVIDMVIGICDTRDIALNLIEKYHDQRLADRVFDLAWTHGQVVLRQLNVTESDVQIYKKLANSIIYNNSTFRADQGIIKRNRRGQSGLWSFAISGDIPIVLLKIADSANIEIVYHLVQAHAYWRMKGLTVDLVIWNEDQAGYRQQLHDQILSLIASGIEANMMGCKGGIFIRPAEQISNEDRILFQSVARFVLSDTNGTLQEMLNKKIIPEKGIQIFNQTKISKSTRKIEAPLRNDLVLYNGIGGFTPDGREYIITTEKGKMTPAPWVNVLANPLFGSVISENGVSYTWSENAHEFRLTPWNNDPVSDQSGEVFYIRDEDTGHFWSPSPLPACGTGSYTSRHGFGYSVFEHTENCISSELWVYVAIDASIKFSVLKLRNDSGQTHRLSATGYVEWVLGDLRPKTVMHIITETDQKSGALFARNQYNAEFSDRVGFFDTDDIKRTFTGSRAEFIGRNGTLKNPAAMHNANLSNKVGAALDPCAAIQVNFELASGQEHEIIFRLGVAGRRGADDAGAMVSHWKGATKARNALEAVWDHWNRILSAVKVETPDLSINVMANGWLIYQTIACRIWARSGFYQSGGAYGFRDQLQDMMAIIHTQPQLMREHLLLCASRQFKQGDVQHWWHPPGGRGVRTHCSDDYLWLPLAVYRYVLTTGDTGILEEKVKYLEGRPVPDGEDSYYDMPALSEESDSLYQHCVKAILKSSKYGDHGLPLIGSGDWNDGMDQVGIKGKGESIWLGFFIYHVLIRFIELARIKGDLPFIERCEMESSEIQRNIEKHGWDGEWYIRAYFDDGTPLGSAKNTECRIDSIAQSWSVLSGAAGSDRSKTAMDSLDNRLVQRDKGLIKLLDPPFDKTVTNPGYIKGYVPGVRENGGQYTHAAIWAAMAFTQLGDSTRAWELFNMINPVSHALTPEAVLVYKVEPYVASADVYAVSPHDGRGGWTW
ncbi:TPA: cyclic beta 1-2 glucan synthetase, partial [Candidatus Delongbacteria bacterium]|nr:cyclic beta 1-2 glucan synthetase [Candidatus Delongbacteria bacterium]